MHRISSPFHVGKKKQKTRPVHRRLFAFPTWSTFNEQLCAVLPGNLTWNLKMMVWKMIFLFNWVIFRFHVKFQGCKQNPGLLSLHNRGLKKRPPPQKKSFFSAIFIIRIQDPNKNTNQPGIMSNVSQGFFLRYTNQGGHGSSHAPKTSPNLRKKWWVHDPWYQDTLW